MSHHLAVTEDLGLIIVVKSPGTWYRISWGATRYAIIVSYASHSRETPLLSEVMETMPAKKTGRNLFINCFCIPQKQPSALQLGLRYLRGLKVHGFPVS